MTDVFDWHEGTTPLLISIPHDGRELAPDMAERMTEAALGLPDTDWHVRQLYDFASDSGASVVSANYSRYVVDLNRSSSDDALYPGQLSTGLCPQATFAGEAIYQQGMECDAAEQAARVNAYWQPYHYQLADALTAIREQHGYALLWDAHSIPGEVPLLFDGRLPDLNIGTNNGDSCAKTMQEAVATVAEASPFSSVVNGRFKGGFITRNYGKPADNVHAIQLELAQHCYMDENSLDYLPERADKLRETLSAMLNAFTKSAMND